MRFWGRGRSKIRSKSESKGSLSGSAFMHSASLYDVKSKGVFSGFLKLFFFTVNPIRFDAAVHHEDDNG